MLIKPLPIDGAYRICIEPVSDARGFFARIFDAEIFRENGLVYEFSQDSVSQNLRRGTLRGFHMQRAPHAETKLVRCTSGTAFDVILDLRPGSRTFGQWHAEEISAENRTTVYLPAGIAHGFQTLTDNTEIAYRISPAYVPGASVGVRWDDPDLAIEWPIGDAIVNSRDASLPGYQEFLAGGAV